MGTACGACGRQSAAPNGQWSHRIALRALVEVQADAAGVHGCRRVPGAAMAAKLTPMQLRAATQRRNSYITAGVAFSLVGGVYYYTMQAMSGAPLTAS